VTDIDGNVYQKVTICDQTWTQTNLNVSKYRNGDVIPQVTNPTEWANLTTGAWCYYNNDSANGTIYGKLYNWYAVNDSRGLAPSGWHIPSDAEWNTIINCIDPNANIGNTFYNVAGGKMKSTGTSLWESPNTDATNSSGFTGLPGGTRYDYTFGDVGLYGQWWSSSEGSDNSKASYRFLKSSESSLDKYEYEKIYGLSVRCIKD
jgi:uncharacterized protein (TIGR02145 family)